MKPENEKFDHQQLENEASRIIGSVVVAFSYLETNIGLCLRGLVGGVDVDAVNPIVDRLTFKAKLDALLEVIRYTEKDKPDCISDFELAITQIDKVRVKRNSFIHGRWHFTALAQVAINASPKLPGHSQGTAQRYDIAQLRDELEKVHAAAEAFNKARTKWGF